MDEGISDFSIRKEVMCGMRRNGVILVRFGFLVVVLHWLTACDRGHTEEVPIDQVVSPVPSADAQLQKLRKKGVVVYTELCSGCHGNRGTGGGAVPPLDGSEFVQGDPQRLALIIHKGVFGPIFLRPGTSDQT